MGIRKNISALSQGISTHIIISSNGVIIYESVHKKKDANKKNMILTQKYINFPLFHGELSLFVSPILNFKCFFFLPIN